ncbi:MAG: hypothetical protein IKJ19_03275 [Clostridia bacterium]|nr:hypothetical protein [Clostridia bacterium]
MFKKSALFLSVILSCVAMFGSLVGCKSGGGQPAIDPNDTNKLEIYVYNAGYGYQWAEDILAAFVQEPWVQEKYPGIENKARVEHDELATHASELLEASTSVNKYDIVMGSGLEGKIGPDYNVLDLTEVVYNSQVPGESVLYKDKLLDSYLDSAMYRGKGDVVTAPSYYQVNWASGMTGIMYNETKLNALGFEVPKTTDELLHIMNTVKNRPTDSVYSQTTTFATYGASTYVNYMFYTWWAQYQTSEEYVNFYNGIDSNTESRSPAIFKQQGIYEALAVIEQILHKDNGITWVNPNKGSEVYRDTQNRVLVGNALFMSNGDWVDNELKSFREGLIKLNGHADTVKLMSMPVISAIINKTPSITNDQMLSAVVEAIDAGETSYAGVTAEDFAIVKEAREVVYSIGPGHNACIPSTAVGKDPAVDFLRYMATDKAQEIYIRATNGATLPFEYNLKEKNPSLYATISPMYQGIIDRFVSQNVNILPAQSSFILVKYGNLSPFSSGVPFEDFTTGKSAGDYSCVAEMCFEREYKYWTENNNAVWKNCLRQAGLQ